MISKSFYLILCVVLLFTLSVSSQLKVDEGKKVVMRYIEEVLNKKRLNVLPEVFAERYLFRNIENGSQTKGMHQLQDFLPYLFKAFPDLRYTVNFLVEEKGNIALHATVSGTQRGEFLGFAPSNKKINVAEVNFFKVREVRIVECSRLLDLNTLKYQLSTGDKNVDPVLDYLAEKMLLD